MVEAAWVPEPDCPVSKSWVLFPHQLCVTPKTYLNFSEPQSNTCKMVIK